MYSSFLPPSFFSPLLCLRRSHVTQAGLKLTTRPRMPLILMPPPKDRDDRHAALHSVFNSQGFLGSSAGGVLAYCSGSPGFRPALLKLGMVVHDCIQEVETGSGSEVQGHSPMHRKFDTSLGYTRHRTPLTPPPPL